MRLCRAIVSLAASRHYQPITSTMIVVGVLFLYKHSPNKTLNEKDDGNNTKANEKKEDDKHLYYQGKQPHIELLKKRQRRGEDNLPRKGDRIRFVIVQEQKGAKICEQAEDPMYVLENNLPIDFDYYLDRQIKKPILNIFTPIIGEKEALSLIRGSHNTHHVRITPNKLGIIRFLKKFNNCLNCKRKIGETEVNQAICRECIEEDPYIQYNHFVMQTELANEVNNRFNKIWNHCQNCQGSIHNDVLCNSQDCEIFYKRHELIKKAQEMDDLLKRFSSLSNDDDSSKQSSLSKDDI